MCVPHLYFVAKRDILRDEELTFDYGGDEEIEREQQAAKKEESGKEKNEGEDEEKIVAEKVRGREERDGRTGRMEIIVPRKEGSEGNEERRGRRGDFDKMGRKQSRRKTRQRGVDNCCEPQKRIRCLCGSTKCKGWLPFQEL